MICLIRKYEISMSFGFAGIMVMPITASVIELQKHVYNSIIKIGV